MNKQQIIKKIKKNRIPVRARVTLTYRCNFNCLHCYEQPLKKDTRELNADKWKEILSDLRRRGCMIVTFTGGEIFTFSEFLEVYKFAYDIGLKVELLTNGSLISEETFEVFRSRKPDLVAVSIYAKDIDIFQKFSRTKFDGKIVLDNCVRLKQMGVNINVKFINNKVIQGQYKKVRKFCNDNHIPFYNYYNIRSCTDGSNEPKNLKIEPEELIDCMSLEEIRSLYKKITTENNLWNNEYKMCTAGLTDISIDPMGYVYLCECVLDNRFPLLEEGFDVVWSKIELLRNKHIEVESYCSSCEHRIQCGLCAPTQMLEYGSLDCIPKDECIYNTKLREYIKEKLCVLD